MYAVCYVGSETRASSDSDSTDGMSSQFKIPHREQWLSLRADSGSIFSWPKFGSCFDDVDVVT